MHLIRHASATGRRKKPRENPNGRRAARTERRARPEFRGLARAIISEFRAYATSVSDGNEDETTADGGNCRNEIKSRYSKQ